MFARTRVVVQGILLLSAGLALSREKQSNFHFLEPEKSVTQKQLHESKQTSTDFNRPHISDFFGFQ